MQPADVVGLDGVKDDVGEQVHFFEEVLAKGAQRLVLSDVGQMTVLFYHRRSDALTGVFERLTVGALAAHATQTSVTRALTDQVLEPGWAGRSRDFFDVGAQLHGDFLLMGFVFLHRLNVVPQGVIGFTEASVGVLHPVLVVVLNVGRVGFVACHVATTFPGPTPKTAR